MDRVRKYYIHILIILIILFGIDLRIAIINCPLWYDEGHSILAAIHSFPFGIDNFLYTKDFQHTPFYFYYLHFWIKIFGTSEIMLRLSSTIFGIAIIPLTYVVAKKIYKNDKIVAVISAILVSVSPLLVYYSNEIRMYIAVTFLAVLSVNYLLDYEEKADKKSLMKLLITNTFIPYLLIGGIVFNIGQAVAYTVYLFETQKENKLKIKEYLNYRVYQIILLIPYFFIAFYYIYKRSQFIMFHIPNFQFMNFVGNIQNFFGAQVGMLYWTNYLPYTIDFMFFISVIIPIIYFINALIKAFKEKDNKLYMIFLMVFIAYSLVLISCMLKIIVLVPRYIIFIVPFVMILSAVGLSKLKKWNTAFFLILFSSLSMYYIFTSTAYHSMKQDAIIDANNYFAEHKLNNNDRVFRPFASSVSFIYADENSPVTPAFEALHEFRKPDNQLVYDDEQIKMMKQGYVDKLWLTLIQSDGHVSRRYYDYLKKNYIKPVKSGRYVVFIIYGPDNQVIMKTNEYREKFNTEEAVHNDRVLASMAKIFDDTVNIFLEDCNLIDTKTENENTYILFQKK